jgi:hypothetical protein
MAEKTTTAIPEDKIKLAARYYEALGRFVTIFSELEVDLQRMVWDLAGIHPSIAPTILPGLRIETAMSCVNRIADVQQWDKTRRTELEYIFHQLGDINKLRNDILHYGSKSHDAEQWTVTNLLFAHIPSKVRILKITPDILLNAAMDLSKILLHLLLLFGHRHISDGDRALSAEIVASPWQYKPPLQAVGRHTTPDSRKERKPPRRPSRGRPPIVEQR